MKRKHGFLLLCAAVASLSTVTPAMAQDNGTVLTTEGTAEYQTQGDFSEGQFVDEEEGQTGQPSAEKKEEEQTSQPSTEKKEEEQTDQPSAEKKDEEQAGQPSTEKKEEEQTGQPSTEKKEEEEQTSQPSTEKKEEEQEQTSQPSTEKKDENTSKEQNAKMEIPETGWYKEDGYWYYYQEGDYLYYTISEINGKLYHFSWEGILSVNTKVMWEGTLYSANADGVLTRVDTMNKTGWEKSGEDYYLYVNGTLIKDQLYTYQGTTYGFDSDGIMQVGVFWVDGKNYLAEPSGKVASGTPTDGWYYSKGHNAWYYFRNGEPLNGEFLTLGKREFFLDYSGKMQTGIFWYNGDYYFADKDGVIQRKNGWQKADGKYYYVKSDGTAAIDEFVLNHSFYLDDEGVMQTGKFVVYDWESEEWRYYCAQSDGRILKNQWVKIGSSYYYTDQKGAVLTSQWIFNDFYLDHEGVMQTGKFYLYDDGDDEYYYAGSDGRILKNQWVKDGPVYYFAGKDGKLLRNQWLYNKYYLNYSGAMVVGAYEIDGTVYKFNSDGSLISEVKKNGWQYADGSWYYYENGSNVDGWRYYNYAWYYFWDSKMASNAIIYNHEAEKSEKIYYVDHTGKMVSGKWINYTPSGYWSNWIYAEADGSLVQDGWKQIRNKWYYFEYAFMRRNEVRKINNTLYLFDKDGVWKEGAIKKASWVQTDNGIWYYINADGTLNKDNEKIINGTKYYFYSDGQLMTNTSIYSDDGCFCVDGDGRIVRKDGWKELNGNWFYILNGKCLNGLQTIGGKQYYFEPYMYIGMRNVYNEENRKYEWMFFGADGARQTLKNGWMSIKVDGQVYWYYIVDGEPVREGWYNGYYFYHNGLLVYGAEEFANDKCYYFDENGKIKKNGWIQDGNIWYYADSSGILLTGEHTINGKTYWFDQYGVLLK